MKLRLLVSLLLLSFVAARGADEAAVPKRSLLQRLNPFDRSAAKEKPVKFEQLEMEMTAAPLPIRLSDVKQVKVALTLTNKGKRLVQLEFPTSQRIEVLVRSPGGKIVETWSEDQAFTAEPTLVAINPGERLQYTASVSTRDLQAGEAYVIEAFFPTFPTLRKTLSVTAQK